MRTPQTVCTVFSNMGLIAHTISQDKLAELKRQLEQLRDGVLPEYSKRLRRLEASHKERVRVNAVIRELEEEMVEQDFVNEKKASAREYEEHKVSFMLLIEQGSCFRAM